MDADEVELIVRLCTRAGMMMQDASADAIGAAGAEQAELVVIVDKIEQAGRDILALALAAAAILTGCASLKRI